MKKTIFKLSLVIISVFGVIFIYSIFTKTEMTSTTKIICKYFENIKEKKQKKEIDKSKIDINNRYLDRAGIYPIIKYEDAVYQFAGYEIDKEAVYTDKRIDLCYVIDRQNIDIITDITENVYELKNISLKYAFAYKDKDSYYLYAWLNVDTAVDIKSKMGNFDELFSEVNRDGQICFYAIKVFIHIDRKDDYINKSIMCYGDIDKLLNKHILGKEFQNVGLILPGRRTVTNITRYKKYKDADIHIWGYMKDVKTPVLLSINNNGYLGFTIQDIWIDTCFLINDNQIEAICQDILENFEIYPEGEKITKME